MGPIISSTSFLYRGMARMITRAPVRYLSTFVISLAASTAGYGQGPALGAGSNPGKDSPGSAAEVRVADTSSAPENWISSYVDPVQGSSSIDLARRALQSNAQLAASRLEIDRARAVAPGRIASESEHGFRAAERRLQFAR